MPDHTSVVKATEREIKSQVFMDDKEVSHVFSRLPEIPFSLKSLPHTQHRACSSRPCNLRCPPGLAVCCSRRWLNHRQVWGSGAQLYQQDPSVPVLTLRNEWSQEMNSPVKPLGQDATTRFHPPHGSHLFLVLLFPNLETPAFLERGNEPEMLSKSTRFAMVQ